MVAKRVSLPLLRFSLPPSAGGGRQIRGGEEPPSRLGQQKVPCEESDNPGTASVPSASCPEASSACGLSDGFVCWRGGQGSDGLSAASLLPGHFREASPCTPRAPAS